MRVTVWQITLKNQATYSGADSARELLSVEQLGESGWDCLSFLVLFELPGTNPARCAQGIRELPALATQRAPQIKVWHSSCPVGWKGDSNKWEAPEAGGEFRWAWCDVPLFYGCAGPWSHGKQSQPGDSMGDTAWGQPGWHSECSQAHPKSAKEGPVNQPVPDTGHPLLPLHLLDGRKSCWTCSGHRVPRTKPLLTLWGQIKGKVLCEAEGKSMDLVTPEHQGCASAECEVLSLLPRPWLESSALFAAGKRACETSVRHLAQLRKAQLLSFKALTKPWAGLDGCCQVYSDLAKEAEERTHKMMAKNK